MDNTANYLQVLKDSLDKKIDILQKLSQLTEEQHNYISQASELDDDIFRDNLDKKDELINELLKLDEGFQLLYDGVKNQIEPNRDRYAREISGLQEQIKSIVSLSEGLKASEARNRSLIEEKFANVKKDVYQVRKGQKTVANYYKTMNNITSEPYFMDKKK